MTAYTPTAQQAAQFHELANIFPMMSQPELQALAEDIRTEGLRSPIVRWEGKVLEGRNRLVACEMVGVVPTFEEFTGDRAGALELVKSSNLHRRHLTDGQRAAAAVKLEAEYAKLTATRKGGRPSKAKADVDLHPVSKTARSAAGRAATEMGVSQATVARAKKVKSANPALFEQVTADHVSVNAAYQQVRAPEEHDAAEQDADQPPRSTSRPTPPGRTTPEDVKRAEAMEADVQAVRREYADYIARLRQDYRAFRARMRREHPLALGVGTMDRGAASLAQLFDVLVKLERTTVV